MIKYRFLIFFILLFSVVAFSQTEKATIEELKKIRSAYLQNQQMDFDVEAYSYKDKFDKSPELISKGHVKKSADKYYSHFLDYELMLSGEKALIVDNGEKKMEYYEYKMNKQKTPESFQINIDSLMANSDSIVMRSPVNGQKHFTIFNQSGEISQTELYVNEKTNFVQHILYYYASSNENYEIEVDRVEIYYKNIKTQGVDEKFFSFDKYFTHNKKQFIPVGQYAAYKFQYYNTK